MVMQTAVTPESSGWGLSHSTFFYFLCNDQLCCPASASAGNSRQVAYFEVSKASVVAASSKGKHFDSISGRVHRNQIDAR